jgi:hypothetical protein
MCTNWNSQSETRIFFIFVLIGWNFKKPKYWQFIARCFIKASFLKDVTQISHYEPKITQNYGKFDYNTLISYEILEKLHYGPISRKVLYKIFSSMLFYEYPCTYRFTSNTTQWVLIRIIPFSKIRLLLTWVVFGVKR